MKRQDYKADYAKALKFAARKGLSVADQLQFAADFANTGSLWTTLNEAYAQFKIDYAEISDSWIDDVI